MSDLTLTGTVKAVFETVKISDKFRKRDVVVTTADNPDYPQHISIQFTQDNVDKLNGLKVGEQVTININLRGREYEKDGETRYFNTVEGWRIETQGTNAPTAAPSQPASIGADESDDLPF